MVVSFVGIFVALSINSASEFPKACAELSNASYDYEELKRKFSHLSVLPNSSFNLMEIGIILGQDVYDLQRPVDYRKGQTSEPFAVLTKPGWVVSGPMTRSSNGNVCHSAFAEDVKMA